MDIIIPTETYLIEIVTDYQTKNNHYIYFLDINGKIITSTEINGDINNIINNLKHIYIIQFTNYDIWQMHCKTMFNKIFEPDIIPYNNIQAWEMPPELIKIIRHYTNIKKVSNYTNTQEYQKGEKQITDYIHSSPTPIEKKDKNIHQQGIQSRALELKIIQQWIK